MFKKFFSILTSLMLVVVSVSCTPAAGGGELNTNQTDATKLQVNYQGKDFTTDGIGRVTLKTLVDGDTTYFNIPNNPAYAKDGISLRYVGLDTPETTGGASDSGMAVEPWGKTAKLFVKDKLTNAKTIVLECETSVYGPKDSSGRWLGLVWYQPKDVDGVAQDFRLLNLEMVEQALSENKFIYPTSKYFQAFKKAGEYAESTGKRVYGEVDPDYNNELTVVPMTINHLLNNFNDYASLENSASSGVLINLDVIIVSFIGSNMYVIDAEPDVDEQGNPIVRGIYVYAGYNFSWASVASIGWRINIVCGASEFNGSPQLVGIITDDDNPLVWSRIEKGITVDPKVVTPSTDLSKEVGSYVTCDVIAERVDLDTNNKGVPEVTVRCKILNSDGSTSGSSISIRVDAAVNPKYGDTGDGSDYFTVGTKYRVTGCINKFYDNYQIMLGNNKNKTNKLCQIIE